MRSFLDKGNSTVNKKVKETIYLSADNFLRYRIIMRIFYEQHQRLRYWLKGEELLLPLKESLPLDEALNYSEDLLQQDLQQLFEWGNLNRRQSGKVNRIEDFKKKRFRYEATPYSIKIERLLIELESSGQGYGGSLEVTDFEKLAETLRRLLNGAHQTDEEMETWSGEKLFHWWNELVLLFKRVTDNARDYLANLDSVLIDELVKGEQFVLYKDRVTDYLRRFMIGLQRSAYQIEGILSRVDVHILTQNFQKIANYDASRPRFEEAVSEEGLIETYQKQWAVINQWFVGASIAESSDVEELQKETNQAIRRIARHAQRMGEKQFTMRSRRSDYLYLAEWFNRMETENEAHILGAAVFGLSQMKHIWVEEERRSEDIYETVWESEPSPYYIKPRTRQFRERTKSSIIKNNEQEKQALINQYLIQQQTEREQLKELISRGEFKISDLTELTPFLRHSLLQWISICIASADKRGKTEFGDEFHLLNWNEEERVRLESLDGVLEMPNYHILFTKT